MRFRGCLQVIVKFLNLLLFVIGVAIILYSVWMLREFKHHHDDDLSHIRRALNSAHFDLPPPWFIYGFMGVGVIACLITFAGYIAAEVASGCCLCCHSVTLVLFLFLQAALAATIFFDHTWEKDFPDDPSGEIHNIRHFIETNAEFCKWIALSVVILEGLTLMFGLILRAVVGDFRRGNDDSDDEFIEAPFRQASLRAGPSSDIRSESWSTRLTYAPSESRRLLQPQSPPAAEENRSRCTIL